jgi:hypothetical protein
MRQEPVVFGERYILKHRDVIGVGRRLCFSQARWVERKNEGNRESLQGGFQSRNQNQTCELLGLP